MEFHAHRVCLAANSAFFRRMFASGMRESAAGRVHLPADAAVSVAAIAAFVRYARTGAFPAEAPAAEVLSLCRRFGANPATKAACRAVEEARDDGADAMTLLTIAQDLGVDLARVLEDEDQETDEEEEEEEKEKKEKKGNARETRRSNARGRFVGESSVVVDGAATGLDDSDSTTLTRTMGTTTRTRTRTRTRTILTLRVARIARWRVCFARARTRWRPCSSPPPRNPGGVLGASSRGALRDSLSRRSGGSRRGRRVDAGASMV